MLERNSSLDNGYGETPLRIYPLGGQPTLRLTFRTGAQRVLGHPGDATGTTRPSLADKSFTQRINGREYDLYYSGLAPAHGRAARRRRDLLGREHAARLALERDDARDRQGPAAAAPVGSGRAREAEDRRLRGRLGRPRHGRLLRRARPRGRRARRRAGADRGARSRASVPFHEPGLAELLERNRERLTLHARRRRRWLGARSSSSASTRRRPTRATPTSPRVWTVVDELPALEERRDPRDEEHGAGRHRREGARRARRARARARRLRLEPGVPRRGQRGATTSCIPTAIVIGAFDRGRRRRGRGALRARSTRRSSAPTSPRPR